MLPPANRLKKKKDFERVFNKGRGSKENFLYLKAAKNGLDITRFGFVVTKKFSLKATARNKIKRKLREIIRINMPHFVKGVDAIIMVLPGLQISDFWELETIVKRLLERGGLIK